MELLSVPYPGTEPVTLRRIGVEALDQVQAWLDLNIRDDYFFRRRHLAGILSSSAHHCWAVETGGQLIGVAFVYHGTTLHNLYLQASWRRKGLGAALVRLLQPQRIRAKTNMLAADPTGFYEKQGYRVESADPARPWILNMALSEGCRMQEFVSGASNGSPGPAAGAVSPPSASLSAETSVSAAAPVNRLTTIGAMTAEKVKAMAGRLRQLGDDELVAMALEAREHGLWQDRQRAARQRRLDKEKALAIAAAAGHLTSDLTGEARARVAKARAASALADLFSPNGEATRHSE